MIIAALRSGEYTQGRGRRRSEDTGCFCFAGVVCDVAAKAGLGEWRRADGWRFVPNEPISQTYGSCMPLTVATWAGFKHDQLDHPVYGPTHIYRLNDTYKVTFEEFADLLEKQL